jgi:putative tryptophan/tyrosine transport system substrate-binding protein
VAARCARAAATIGFLGATALLAESQRLAAFVQRLRELGWIEGRNVAIEIRWAEGRTERFAEIAAEFVRLKVDVILTHNTPPVLAAKQVTSVIPIVFATAGDPVGTGVVASLARPGGNVTGLSSQQTDTNGKRLELLREVVPSLRRLAILANVGAPNAALEMREVHTATRTLGLEVAALELQRAEDIAPALEALKGRADALYVCVDPLINSNRVMATPSPKGGVGGNRVPFAIECHQSNMPVKRGCGACAPHLHRAQGVWHHKPDWNFAASDVASRPQCDLSSAHFEG